MCCPVLLLSLVDIYNCVQRYAMLNVCCAVRHIGGSPYWLGDILKVSHFGFLVPNLYRNYPVLSVC